MEWGIPTGLTFWELANSQATGTSITAIATIVGAIVGGRIVRRVAEQTEQQKKTAVQEQLARHSDSTKDAPSEEEIQEVEAQAGREAGAFSRASSSFKQIRQAVDSLIGQITDGRRKRKYKGLRKTDLREHVYLLWQDDMLGLPIAELVDNAITEFYSYRTKPNEIPDDVVELIAKAAKQMHSLAN